SWVQVDLGEAMPIDGIRIILADLYSAIPDSRVRFPNPLKIEVSEEPDLRNAEFIAELNPNQIAKGGNNPVVVRVNDGYGRYVRLTVNTKSPQPIQFDLAELEVFSGNLNVSLGKDVVASHSKKSKEWAPSFLVDGFSSRRNLVPYQDWLANLGKRNNLVREWVGQESQRLDLVDKTVTRGVTYLGGGVAGVLLLSLGILVQSRVNRKKDLEALRQRIASDLHDDIGSNLSSIALLAELGKTEVDEPELLEEELDEIKQTADKTIESMRDIVWLIRPGEETWNQMITRFRETASKLLRAHEYEFNLVGHMHDDRLPLEFKRDFFLIYKEVLNNIVRHAEASEVSIDIETKRNKLTLQIKDNGKGFNNLDQEFREGNGLRNLRMRAQAIGANLKVKSTPDVGTTVLLTAPMP
ncbi:MAG: histidine kinase, partial [Verrucomicrobiota bacterium]